MARRSDKKNLSATRAAEADPAKALRRVTTQVDRMFDQEFRWPPRKPADAAIARVRRVKSRATAARPAPEASGE
jgi:hypothetical protein